MIHKWVLILFVQIKFLLNTVFFSVTSRTNYNINNYYWSVSLFALNNESIFNITLEDSTWGAAAAVTAVSFLHLPVLFSQLFPFLYFLGFFIHSSSHTLAFTRLTFFTTHTQHTHTRLFAHRFLLSLSTTQDFLVYN